MFVQKVERSGGDTVAHGADVLFVERGGPNVVFVGQSVEQVARSGSAVPDGVFVLPVVAQLVGQVLLREFDPALRREVGAAPFADVLRHEQVAAFNDVVPVFAARWALIAVPERGVRPLLVVEINAVKAH